MQKSVKRVGGKNTIKNEKQHSIYFYTVHVKLTSYKKDLSQPLGGRKELKRFMLVEVYTYCTILKNTYLHIYIYISQKHGVSEYMEWSELKLFT